MDYKEIEVQVFRRNYNRNLLLGAGAFGVTYLCENKVDKKLYAVKVIPCSERDTKKTLKECKTMGILEHDNIVLYHTAWIEAGVPAFAQRFIDATNVSNSKKQQKSFRTVFIAMQYYPRLLQEEIEKSVLTEAEIKKIFNGLVKGLSAIHDKGWVHCDIHPGNIFLDNSGNPKIGDFGLAREIGTKDKDLGVGNILYQPTEVLAPKEVLAVDPHTPGSDMYSFALCMLEVACSLKADKKVEVFGEATAGLFPEEFIRRNDVISLTVRQILTARPNERMKASAIFLGHKTEGS